jgi:hypothetical protein
MYCKLKTSRITGPFSHLYSNTGMQLRYGIKDGEIVRKGLRKETGIEVK